MAGNFVPGVLSQWKSAFQVLFHALFNNALYTCDERATNGRIFSKWSERRRGLMWGTDTKKKYRTPAEIRTDDLPNISQQRYRLSRLDYIYTYVFLIIKSTRCTNFSNLFFEIELYMFQAVPLTIIRSFHCAHSHGICRTGLLTAGEQDQSSSVLILLASCQQTCTTYTMAVCTMKTPDDGQRNCPKHVVLFQKINLTN